MIPTIVCICDVIVCTSPKFHAITFIHPSLFVEAFLLLILVHQVRTQVFFITEPAPKNNKALKHACVNK